MPDKNNDVDQVVFWWWWWVPISTLLLACLPFPYFVYHIVRLVVFIGSVLVAFSNYKETNNLNGWACTFAVVALLYNPLFQVHLGSKFLWVVINVSCAALFGVSYAKVFKS